MPAPRRRTLLLTLVILLLVLALPVTASAQTSTTALEVSLTKLVNEARSRNGLAPLRVDVRLVRDSRRWTAELARRGSLGHDPDYVKNAPYGASRWAENVARARATGDVGTRLHDLVMGSGAHRANVLDARFTDLGIGIVLSGDQAWLTQRFTAGAPARVSGAVEGAADLATATFGGGKARHAVISRDDVHSDALTAGPLAGSGGPLMLSPPGPVLHPSVRLALERTLPPGRTVYIIGGNAAVSSGVESELGAGGWKVRRVAGPERISTAVAVSEQLRARDGRPSMAMVATAHDWPDAAAGGAFGAHSGAPVLLSYRNELPAATRDALRDLGSPPIVALGGSSVLSDGVVRTLGATRVAGPTRAGTSAAVARDLWGYTGATAQTWIGTPASGDSWAWALTAAPIAAQRRAPVILIGDQLSDDLRRYLQGLGYGGSSTAELRTHGPVPSSGAEEAHRLLR